jgi:gliding motility-associated-like protein
VATITNLQPGRYQMVWEMDNGVCGPDSRDTVEVLFKNNPVTQPESYVVAFGEPLDFNVLDNDVVPPESFVNIVNPPNHGTLQNLGGGRFIFQPSFDYAGADRFFYELCSEACECALEEVSFNIGENAGCEIPSVFTPNNDGVNDFFVVPCLFNLTQYSNSQLVIINRWGDEVFRSARPYLNDWQGRYNGEDLPVGTYFYILDFGNGEEPVSSFFMIQR